ncbi:MAG: CBS domain-containing protein [Planctomycetes bacterium]|nr:CBS domain-containing protein [Planctomycetota bacterium]
MNVSKYMTSKLITAKPDMSVKEAFFTMRRGRVRHLPVLDGDKLVGIISDRDLRRPKWAEDLDDWTSYYQIDENLQVGDVMTKNPETVCTRDEILTAVKILRERRYGALPVLNRKGELVGILSAQDLLAALEEMLLEKGQD